LRLVLGIDESGYGPRVGPLVVASCTLAVPDSIAAVGPELAWSIAGAVEPPAEGLAPTESSPKAVYIGDSKQIFFEGWPLELERSALALIDWLRGGPVAHIGDALGVVAHPIDPLPWLAPELGRFPLCERRPAAALGGVVELRDLSAHVLSARQMNAATERVDNKALVNWALVAMLIERAVAAGEPLDLEIAVDRQGGRIHYEDLLRELFAAPVEIVEKTARRSAYRIPARPEIRSIEFLVEGDSRCAAISIASIIAKYTRELLMARLNDFFCSRQPGLAPTEGYFRDGRRFVTETAALRAELGIADADFVRIR
jgi:ribonuclease HII